MSTIVAIDHLSLDGVMQAPGRPDEDTRGGFTAGGWAGERSDETVINATGVVMAETSALLLGRQTYSDFAEFWPRQPENPFTAALTKFTKYVVSTTLTEPLGWENSTVIGGDVSERVRRLKERTDGTITVFGSGVLVQALQRAGLVDEYLLMIHPLLLGRGTRLFADGTDRASLRLVDSETTARGVIIARYQAGSGSTQDS